MKESILKTKTFDFAVRIVSLYQFAMAAKKESTISKQLLRSGISVGANIREAQYAESPADFVHKLSIALKEASESDYWIDLLYHGKYLDKKQYDSIKIDVIQIIRLLTSSIKTCKNNKGVNK